VSGTDKTHEDLEREIARLNSRVSSLCSEAQLFRTALQSIADAMIAADTCGNVLRMNPVAERLTGWRETEAIDQPIFNVLRIVNKESRAEFESLLGSVLNGEVVFGEEKCALLNTKDGSEHCVANCGMPIRNLAGEITGAQLIFRDRTTELTTQQALHASEELFRSTFDRSTVGKSLSAPDGKIIRVNQAFADMLGLTIEEMQQVNFIELTHPDDVEKSLECLRCLLNNDRPSYRIEKRYRHRDGHFIFADVSIALIRDQLEKPLYSITSVTDITDRKRAEQALREKEFLLTESQRLGHVGSWLWDMKGPIAWSDETYRIYGVSRDTFVPTVESLVGLIYPDDRSAMHQWITACAALDIPGELDFRVCMPDGAVRFVRGRGQAVHDAQNEPMHMAGTAQDITPMKLAEEQREKLEEQLRASQKMEAVGRLAGGVAHDFNNLLSVILMYTGFAMEGATENAPQKDDLLVVKNAADKAAALTHKLLAFGRKQVLQPVPLDLGKIAAGLEDLLRQSVGENIDFVQVLAPDLGLTLADPSQLEQVLINLVANARDAMPRGGRLTIETSNIEIDDENAVSHSGMLFGSYVQLVVTDTGIGLDEQTRVRIFEPFFTTKPMGKGAGLGLSTVYGIITQSGGNIKVFSEPGCGTTFKIYLPRELSTTMSKAPRPSEVPSRTARGETILLVEDEEALRSAARRILDAAGYTVLTAKDGNDALLTAAQYVGDVHLLLTDVVMPHMSGVALADKLSKVRPMLKVLYMSGYADNAVVEHCVLVAGTHFVSKPFTREDLTRQVREVLDET
jgi:PAS domain S-box-containing protein